MKVLIPHEHNKIREDCFYYLDSCCKEFDEVELNSVEIYDDRTPGEKRPTTLHIYLVDEGRDCGGFVIMVDKGTISIEPRADNSILLRVKR